MQSARYINAKRHAHLTIFAECVERGASLRVPMGAAAAVALGRPH